MQPVIRRRDTEHRARSGDVDDDQTRTPSGSDGVSDHPATENEQRRERQNVRPPAQHRLEQHCSDRRMVGSLGWFGHEHLGNVDQLPNAKPRSGAVNIGANATPAAAAIAAHVPPRSTMTVIRIGTAPN